MINFMYTKKVRIFLVCGLQSSKKNGKFHFSKAIIIDVTWLLTNKVIINSVNDFINYHFN